MVNEVYPTLSTQYADVVLPVALWVEREGQFGNAERRTAVFEKAVDAPGEAKWDLWTFMEVAHRVLDGEKIGSEDAFDHLFGFIYDKNARDFKNDDRETYSLVGCYPNFPVKDSRLLERRLSLEQIYDPSPDEAVYQSVRAALETARTKAAAAVNDAMVSAYWEIGRQIVEAQGDRAEYGQHLMEYLSERLTAEFGKGFTERNLRAMRQLYLAYPIRHTLCAELIKPSTLPPELARLLVSSATESCRHCKCRRCVGHR